MIKVSFDDGINDALMEIRRIGREQRKEMYERMAYQASPVGQAEAAVEMAIQQELCREERARDQEVQKWKARLHRGGWSVRFMRLRIYVEKLMSNVKDLGERQLTPFEIAQREIAEEKRQAAVQKLKDLLRKRAAAETVLANIDREIADANEAISQGNKV